MWATTIFKRKYEKIINSSYHPTKTFIPERTGYRAEGKGVNFHSRPEDGGLPAPPFVIPQDKAASRRKRRRSPLRNFRTYLVLGQLELPKRLQLRSIVTFPMIKLLMPFDSVETFSSKGFDKPI